MLISNISSLQKMEEEINNKSQLKAEVINIETKTPVFLKACMHPDKTVRKVGERGVAQRRQNYRVALSGYSEVWERAMK